MKNCDCYYEKITVCPCGLGWVRRIRCRRFLPGCFPRIASFRFFQRCGNSRSGTRKRKKDGVFFKNLVSSDFPRVCPLFSYRTKKRSCRGVFLLPRRQEKTKTEKILQNPQAVLRRSHAHCGKLCSFASGMRTARPSSRTFSIKQNESWNN